MEHRINFRAGITRNPSDFLSEDGELAECINLTADGHELKPIHRPEKIFGGEVMKDNDGQILKIIFVHKFNGVEHFIFQSASGKLWYTEADLENDTIGPTVIMYNDSIQIHDITAIGTRIIISEDAGLHIFMWRQNSYKDYGVSLPDPNIRFWMENTEANFKVEYKNFDPFVRERRNSELSVSRDFLGYNSNGDYIGRSFNTPPSGSAQAEVVSDLVFEDNKKETTDGFNNQCIATAEETIHIMEEKGRFCFPFWVRYALRLSDGKYAMISNPQLMLPSVRRNCIISPFSVDNDGHAHPYNNTEWLSHALWAAEVQSSVLCYEATNTIDMDKWEGVISGIDIFVSDCVYPFDMNEDWQIRNSDGTKWDYTDYVSSTGEYRHLEFDTSKYISQPSDQKTRAYNTHFVPKWKSDDQIIKELIEKSQFYKLASIDLQKVNGLRQGDYGSLNHAQVPVEKNVIRYITNQPILENDDYFGHTYMVPSMMTSFNNRLQLTGVHRSFFSGFERFCNIKSVGSYSIDQGDPEDIYVKIETDSGTFVVKKVSHMLECRGYWFYYPDPRAKEVIFRSEGENLHFKLTEHPHLNGAYYFGKLPSQTDTVNYANETAPSLTTGGEYLQNQLLNSKVGNPWVYTAGDVSHISNVKDILAISPVKAPLSQDNFGSQPFVCYTSDGIWGMGIANDGTFAAKQTVSGDVITNTDGILQTDIATFFPSKKGLMAIIDGGVQNVSDMLSGRSANIDDEIQIDGEYFDLVTAAHEDERFKKFLENSFMAYDYIDRQIFIMKAGSQYGWVLNTDGMQMSKIVWNKRPITAVNNYPDYIIEDEEGCLYSLYRKKDEEDADTRQKGFLLTRPLKLSSAIAMKVIKNEMVYGQWTERYGSSVRISMMVSNDLHLWYPRTSVGGSSFKFVRLAVYTNLLPSERLSSAVIVDDTRYEDKLR